MRTHRAAAIAAAVALLGAASAQARSTVTIGPFAKALRGATASMAVARKDTRHSCQTGPSAKRVRLPGPAPVGETERKAAAVACEQPPRSEPNITGALQTAQTGAIAALG